MYYRQVRISLASVSDGKFPFPFEDFAVDIQIDIGKPHPRENNWDYELLNEWATVRELTPRP